MASTPNWVYSALINFFENINSIPAHLYWLRPATMLSVCIFLINLIVSPYVKQQRKKVHTQCLQARVYKVICHHYWAQSLTNTTHAVWYMGLGGACPPTCISELSSNWFAAEKRKKKQNAPFALSHNPTINMFCNGINIISHVMTDLLTYLGLCEKYTVDFYSKWIFSPTTTSCNSYQTRCLYLSN